MSTNSPTVVTSVRFSRTEAKSARAAARKLGLTLSAFVTKVVAARAAEIRGVCPTCGRAREHARHARERSA